LKFNREYLFFLSSLFAPLFFLSFIPFISSTRSSFVC
jgi:hypothetical protein